MIPLLINQSNISGYFLAIVEMSSRFRSSCYWTDWNWANSENIHIGLVFAILVQCKFLYCIDRFGHIKAIKSKLINNIGYFFSLSERGLFRTFIFIYDGIFLCLYLYMC